MSEGNVSLERMSLVRTLAVLEGHIAAVGRGERQAVVDVPHDQEHPLGALALAINDMVEALTAAEQARRHQERELEERVRLIREQSAAIRELSSPVIEVWQGVLTLPVVGSIDPERANGMTANLLDQVVRKRAALAIIDLTGMRSVGADVCDHVVRMARCVRLLGADSVVSGVRPEVARTIIELGAQLGEIRCHPTLRDALTEHVKQQSAKRRSAVSGARIEIQKERNGA